MKSSAETVDQYLRELTPDRREVVSTVRDVILANLPEGYEETMDFGMMAYVVPLARYPKTYNGHPLSYSAISSEKHYVSVHLMNIYADPKNERWFIDRYKATGKKLDMGKSCVRFRKLDDLPLGLIGEAISRTSMEEWIRCYEASRPAKKPSGSRRSQVRPDVL